MDENEFITEETALETLPDTGEARRSFSRIGLSIFMLLLVSSVVQVLAGVLVGALFPDITADSPLFWLCTFIPIYLIGVPIGLLMLRKVPAERPEKSSLSFGQFISAVIIAIFLMYAGNLLGTVITSLIGAFKGSAPANAVLTYALGNSALLKILFLVVLAPAIEEYIFRKALIDRIRPYGEKLAVVTSAVLFALFHGNLSQMFYAFGLGLVFGYIYCRTGRLIYSVILHMFINFLGSVVAPALLGNLGTAELDAASLASDPALLSAVLPLVLYALAMITLSVIGLVLFCKKVRKLRFEPAEKELPRGSRFKTVYINVGMILLIVGCLGLVALTFLV